MSPPPKGTGTAPHLQDGCWEAEPVHKLTMVPQPVGSPDADPLVPASSQPQVRPFYPKVFILGEEELVGASWQGLSSAVPPTP